MPFDQHPVRRPGRLDRRRWTRRAGARWSPASPISWRRRRRRAERPPRRRRCRCRPSPRSPCCRSPTSRGDPEQDYFADGMVEEIIAGAVALQVDLRHRQRLEPVVQGQGDDAAGGRADARRALCAGGQRPQGGRPRAHRRPADRRRRRRADLGRPVRGHAGGRVRPAGQGGAQRRRRDRADGA